MQLLLVRWILKEFFAVKKAEAANIPVITVDVPAIGVDVAAHVATCTASWWPKWPTSRTDAAALAAL